MLSLKQLLLVAKLEAVVRKPSGRVGSDNVRVPHVMEPQPVVLQPPKPEVPKRLCQACQAHEHHSCRKYAVLTSYAIKMKAGRLKRFNITRPCQCSCRAN